MQGEPNGYWAKTGEDDNGPVWLPLAVHLCDVAACFETLLDCGHDRHLAKALGISALSRRQKERLAVLVYLHDLGKMNLGFQAKGPGWEKFSVSASTGHTTEPLTLFDSEHKPRFVKGLGMAEMARWFSSDHRGNGEAFVRMLATTLGHHGRPVRWQVSKGPETGVAPLWDGMHYADFDGCLAEIMSVARKAWPLAFENGNPEDVIHITPAFADGLNGLTTLADWLGSDTRRFPVDRSLTDETIEDSRSRARDAATEIGIDARNWRNAASVNPGHLFDFDLNAMQSALSTAAETATSDGAVWILEGETGAGKTEAALAFFHRLFVAGHVDSLYFALPTRTSAYQIFRRIEDFSLRNYDGTVNVTLAVPGYLTNGDNAPLPSGTVLHDEDKRHINEWASEMPKRYLAAPVAVGTVDQVLASLLNSKHSTMRWAAAGRSLLVIDEVHASDVYMSRILREVVERHVARGGKVLLMSATLGSSGRRSYQHWSRKPEDSSELQEDISRPYPSITRITRDGANLIEIPKEGASSEKKVRLDLLPALDDISLLANEIASHVRNGARVLVIRNTVAGCVDLQRELEDRLEHNAFITVGPQDVPMVHHGRFTPEDRVILDRAVEDHFGKRAQRRPGGLVLVGTQTLEQSLDIDADIIFSDLCPIDVLLQRVGRLHRHRTTEKQAARPEGYQSARCVVVTSVKDLHEFTTQTTAKHGIGPERAYSDVRVVDATLSVVKTHPDIDIPRDNRMLVESATHHQILDAYERNPHWSQHAEVAAGKDIAHSQTAKSFIRPAKFIAGDECPSDIAAEKAMTRIGAGNGSAILNRSKNTILGSRTQKVPIPSWILSAGLLDMNSPADVKDSHQGFEFSVCGKDFVYGRFGLLTI